MRVEVYNNAGNLVQVEELPDPPPHPLEAFAIANDLDYASIRGLFNHENRIRAIVRALRSVSATANTAANTQGVEPARQDMTRAEFGAILKALT